MFEAIQRRDFALILAFFFASLPQARSEAVSQTPIAEAQNTSAKANGAVIKQPELALVPNAVTATTPNKPEVAEPGKPFERKPDASMPGTSFGNTSDLLPDLSASKRLAISVLSGAFTLMAALWIGARRD